MIVIPDSARLTGMRRLVVIVCIAFVLILVIGLSIVAGTVDKYRPRIQTTLQQKLDRPVTLGHLGLKLFPLSISIDGLTVGESPAFHSTQPFATAKDVYVSVGLFSLIRGNPDVKTLRLNQPRIELIRNGQGVWNYSTIGGSTSNAGGGGGGNKSNSVEVGELKVTDGQVAITDELKKQARSVYDHIDLDLTDFAPNQRFGLMIAAHLPGPGQELVSFDGKVGPLPTGGAPTTPPIDGKISVQQVSLAVVNRFDPGALPPNTDGTISGKATVETHERAISCKGDLKLDNGVVRGRKLTYAINTDYDLAADQTADNIQIKSAIIKLGSTALSLAGSYNGGAQPATVDMRVSTKDSSVEDLAQLTGGTGSGRVSLDAHVQGPVSEPSKLVLSGSGSVTGCTLTVPQLTKPVSIKSANIRFAQNNVNIDNFALAAGSTSLQGNLSASNFSAPQVQFAIHAGKIDTAELEQLTSPPANKAEANKATASSNKPAPPSNEPSLLSRASGSGTLSAGTIKAEDIVLNNVQTTCKLDKGVIQLNPLTADIFGGKESGAITLDTRPQRPQCAIKAKLSGADANALLSAVSSVKNTLYGSLAADADLGFALAPGTELARTLNGRVGFNVTNGQLKNVNILNEISKIGKFVGSAPSQSSGSATALQKFSGTLNIQNGVATTNDLTATLDAGSLSANGSMNLVDQGLNMHLNAVLAKGASQAVGGNQVGGMMSTVLANKNGEFVVPVIVTGTTAHPTFAPDVQAIAKMKMNNLLPSVANPTQFTKGGAAGILGGIMGNSNPQQSQGNSQQQQQQNPVNSLLNQLTKKKPKQ